MKLKYPFKLVLVNADGEAITVRDEITDWNKKEQTLTIAYQEGEEITEIEIMRYIIATLEQTAKEK